MKQIDPEFYKLLPLFKKKMIYGKLDDFAFQTLTKWGLDRKNWQFGYDWKQRSIINQDFEKHFYSDYTDIGNKLIGGLAFRSVFGANKNIVKKIVVDADTVDQKEFVFKQLVPKADRLGIEWIVEHGGNPIDHPLFETDRCHWVILTETDVETTTAFMRQFMAELGEAIMKKDEAFVGNPLRFDEVKGTGNQINQAVRFDYGFHLKRMRRFPLLFQGEVLDDPISVMKAFIEMKPVTEVFMKKYIKDDYFPVEDQVFKKIYEGWTPTKLEYNSLRLNIKKEDLMPKKLRLPYRECQALNSLHNDCYDNAEIELQGQQHHDAGLAIAGTARSHDIYFNTNDGKEWFWEDLVENTRLRDAKSHAWWHGTNKEAPIYFWTCDKYNEYFARCKGCKYQGQIRSPREFMFSSPISSTSISTDKKLVTISQIRNVTFPNFKKVVKQTYINQERANYLLASNTGAGKSECVKQLTAEMIESDHVNVLITVPTAKLALEYRDWFKDRGIEAFAHLSHENTFGHQAGKETSLACFDCPYFKEIQAQKKAGVQSSSYKEEFCFNGCPLLDQCFYPNQFSEVMDEKYKVVIIQHAHMSCMEIILNLLKKGFALLIVDETFIDYTYDYIEIDQGEIDLLEGHNEPWTVSLAAWLKGAKAVGKLNPSKGELESCAKTFSGWQKAYRVPQLVRFYNQHRRVNPDTGVEIIYELPSVPIKILTDATPPVDLIKALTGIKTLKIIGANEVIDIKSIHPDNQRYQLLDINNSVTQLKDEEFFEIIMTKICDLIKNKHKDEKCLITCYISDKKRVLKFIEDRYPEILSRVDIHQMAKGTNKWVGYTVQFILAGRYRSGKEYYKDLYKYKAVANYYRRKNDERILPNIYIKDIPDGLAIKRRPVRVQMLQKDSRNVLRLYQYNNDYNYYEAGDSKDKFKQSHPSNNYWWFQQMDLLDISDMIQAERIRPTSEAAVSIYHLHNKHMDRLEITCPITFSEFLSL